MEFLKTIDLFVFVQQNEENKFHFMLILLILMFGGFSTIAYINKKTKLKNKIKSSLEFLILFFLCVIALVGLCKVTTKNDELYPSKERYVQFMETVLNKVSQNNFNVDKTSSDYIHIDLLKYCFVKNHYENNVQEVYNCYRYESTYGKNKLHSKDLIQKYEQSVHQVLNKLKNH